MKKSTKIVAAVVASIAAIVGTVAAVMVGKKMSPSYIAPSAVDPSSIPAELLGSALPEGWSTYGWYSYTVPATVTVDNVKIEGRTKLWIRVDRGPDEEGTILTTAPWRWSIFVDKPAPVGLVPIATGTESWDELRQTEWITPIPDSWWREYHDEGMGQAVATAASDQINAMYGVDT